MSYLLEMNQIKHTYGGKAILDGLNLNLEEGSIGCLLGPSGSGKTTILRIIAGFEDLVEGSIRIRGQVVSKSGWTLRPSERKVGIVFQDYALFPHLTVRENIRMGLHHLPKKESQWRTNKWIDIVGLSEVSGHYPHELSGGQQQRVALARAMAPQPSLLLLDEPFSDLDVDLRDHLSAEVRSILKENQTTALMVTHDQNEAFSIADEIGVLGEGKIEQWGSSYDLYHEPACRFVANFIGKGVFIPGKIIDEKTVKTELGEMSLEGRAENLKGHGVEVLLRPDDIVHDDDSPMQAKVITKAFRGAYILYTLALESGQNVLSHVPSHHNHAIGSSIGIRLEADHVIWFKR